MGISKKVVSIFLPHHPRIIMIGNCKAWQAYWSKVLLVIQTEFVLKYACPWDKVGRSGTPVSSGVQVIKGKKNVCS
jgi:hypothetical protein